VWIATDGSEQKTVTSPVGPDNDAIIERPIGAFRQLPGSIICGWGRMAR
jgi:hypothetical protein